MAPEALSLPGHDKSLAPGMSQVIEAGEYYTLTDDKGKELELVGKLDAKTIAFVRAFDTWYRMSLTGHSQQQPLMHAKTLLIATYQELPSHVTRELIR